MENDGIALVSYELFSKTQLKVGQILNVEDIEGKDKLYKLTIDLGEAETRTLLAGIKMHYTKEELFGKQIIVVANLEPKKMGGLVSQGMLLAACEKQGDIEVISLLMPDKRVALGTQIFWCSET